MHQAFAKHLDRFADLYLLARLKDQRIGFPQENDMRVFIPDLHIISAQRKAEFTFKFGTNWNENDDDLLPTLVRELGAFRKQVKAQSVPKGFEVYQLGDFLDLWRETPTPWNVKPEKWRGYAERIIETNQGLFDAFTSDNLGANFLLGNHDFELSRIPSLSSRWRYLSHYITDAEDVPVGGVIHGDIFSWVERLPDPLQQFAVFHFSPGEKNADKIGKEVALENSREDSDTLEDTGDGGGAATATGTGPDTGLDLFRMGPELRLPPGDRWNVKTKGNASGDDLRYLPNARKYTDRMNSKYDDFDLNMMVLGHTHHPRIAVDESDGNFFALMDCGDWVKAPRFRVTKDGEKTEITVKSAQIGVLCNNEMRIYQLVKKDS